MHILFLSGKNPFGAGPFGGAESSIGLIARKMVMLGHSVTMIASDPPVSDNLTSDAEKIKFIEYKKYRGSIAEYARTVTNLSIARALRAANMGGIDVIYCAYEPNILAAIVDFGWLWRRGNRQKPKTMLRVAGEYWHILCERQAPYKNRYERWFNALDSANFISRYLVQRTADLCQKNRMNVQIQNAFVSDIGNAGLDVFQYQKLGSTEGFRIVMSARFSNYAKRQDLLLDAISQLEPKSGLELLFVGEGPRRSHYEQRVKEMGLGGIVGFKDFGSQEDLWKVFGSSDLLCHFADFEGLCKTVIEAMGVGMPVLCSNIPPFDEYIEDGINGFLVDNDAEKIAAKIHYLVQNRDALERAAARARVSIKARFDPDRNAQLYEREFMALMSGAGEAT